MVRNYVHMQQTMKKTKPVAGHYYRSSFSFPEYSPENDEGNETYFKIITHHDDKETFKPHLTSDFVGPLPSPFTLQ